MLMIQMSNNALSCNNLILLATTPQIFNGKIISKEDPASGLGIEI
jgi:hypothetical protein